MSNFYAQIDAINVVVGISDLGGIFNDSKYVIIDDYDLDLLGKLYTGAGIPGTPFDEDEFEDYYPPFEEGDGEGGTGTFTGGSGLIFPEASVHKDDLNIIKSGHDAKNSKETYFWEGFAYGIDEYWHAGYVNTSNNATEQTIVDITGPGILANVFTPCPKTNNGIMVVTVTIDGFAKVFTSKLLDTNHKYLLGYVAPELEDHGHTAGVEWSEKDVLLITPQEVVYKFRAGFKFETSLKVTVQCDNGMSTDSKMKRAAVSYLTYIPQGF